MRIDVHAHYFPAHYLDLLDALARGEINLEAGRRSSWPTRAADLEARFAAMDAARVDLEILSIASAGPYLSGEVGAVIAAHVVNDTYAELVRAHPRRFAAFAALPLPHVDAALAELARALDELGMAGVGISTMMGGKTIDDPSFDPLYAELDRRGAVLFVHPAGRSCESPLLARTGLTWPLGAPFEDTTCALQLLQCGFSSRFPNVRVIVAHLGGTAPFLVQRLDHMAQRWMPGRGTPSVELRKLWYDSVNGSPAALRCACEAFGAERILFGTDYPFWQGEAHQLAADYLERSGFSDDIVAGFFERNARVLFGDRFAALVH
jgi:6-methylsalicylate decarboxylase